MHFKSCAKSPNRMKTLKTKQTLCHTVKTLFL